MAKKNTNKTPESDRHAKRLTLLNETVQDVCVRIHDGPRAYTVRAIRARSVDPAIVERGFAAMEEAIAEAREAYAAAQKGDDAARVARVDLTRL